MRYRTIIKKSGKWWIGWLIDLPGVNGQERTRERLMESLILGAQDMLMTDVAFEENAQMTTVEVPEPIWSESTVQEGQLFAE